MPFIQEQQFAATLSRLRQEGGSRWQRLHGGVLTTVVQRNNGIITQGKLAAFYGENGQLELVFPIFKGVAFARLGNTFYINVKRFLPNGEPEGTPFAITMSSRRDVDAFEAWLGAATGGANCFVGQHEHGTLLKFAFQHQEDLSEYPPEANITALLPDGIDTNVVPNTGFQDLIRWPQLLRHFRCD